MSETDGFDEIDDGEDFAELSCGLTRNGHCENIGTEWCDWDCPFSDRASHNRALRRKKTPVAAPLLGALLSTRKEG